MYFLYRPRVNVDHPTSVDDIQRFFMIMAPTSRPKAPFRLIIVGKKRLPIPEKHERFFCFTDAVAGTRSCIDDSQLHCCSVQHVVRWNISLITQNCILHAAMLYWYVHRRWSGTFCLGSHCYNQLLYSLHVDALPAALATVSSKGSFLIYLRYHACIVTSPHCLYADSMEKLTEQLGEIGNQSSTRGYRTTEPARIVGEGGLALHCICSAGHVSPVTPVSTTVTATIVLRNWSLQDSLSIT